MREQRLFTCLFGAVFVSVIGLSLQQMANLRLEVEPRFVAVEKGATVNLTCTLSDEDGGWVPLAGCGFRLYGSEDAWVAGTRWGAAAAVIAIKGEQTSGAIRDEGLTRGECGLTFSIGWGPFPLGFGSFVLGCRVRTTAAAWRYGTAMVHVREKKPMQYRLQPPGVVVAAPGSNVTFTGEAEHPLDECIYYLPPKDTWVFLLNRPSITTAQYRVRHQGKRCEVTLVDVRPEGSGFMRSLVQRHSPRMTSADFVELIVATPPASPPRLSVHTTDATFLTGDILHATCDVDESRPVSNVTWLLGGLVIRDDNWNDAPPESAWRWTHDPQIISQRLSRRITQQDDGRSLSCRAGHSALPSGSLDSNAHVIRVRSLPPLEKPNLRLEAEPRSVQVEDDTPVNLMCTLKDWAGAPVPLAECQFTHYGSNAIWDFGTDTTVINRTVMTHDTQGRYRGNGLPSGECGITLAGLGSGYIYVLGCRARPAAGGAWLYAAMAARVDDFSPMQYRLQPPGVSVVVSLPGSDVLIIGKSEIYIDYCGFYLPPNNSEITLQSPHTSKIVTKYWAFLEAKRCTVTLLGVQPEDSGLLSSSAWSFTPEYASADILELVVASPPKSPPRLSVHTTDAPFQAGDMLHATCVVDESRPVSNITWLLGGEVIREDNRNESPAESTWLWNYEPRMITQRLSRRLTQQDDGKELKCRARHLALPSRTLDSNVHIIRV